MVMCFVPDCKHYSNKEKCRMFTFPKNLKERKKWISLVRRKDREPTTNSVICSCHFVGGKKENGPTVYPSRKPKILSAEVVDSKKRKMMSSGEYRLPPPTLSSSSEDISRPGTSLSFSLSSASQSRPGSSCETISTTSSALAQALGDVQIEEQTTIPSTSKHIPPSDVVTNVENYFLKQQVSHLTKKLSQLYTTFSFETIQKHDKLVLLYTGLPNATIYLSLFKLMDKFPLKYYYNWVPASISKIDQLLMTLMKLKLNLPHEDLACRFNCSSSTVSNIFYTWLYALHEVIFKQLMQDVPSRAKNKTCLPTCFSFFTNCRIILDCTEISTIVPHKLQSQKATHSSYKHRNTLKGLVGVAPNGVVTYLSELYPGSTSDKVIVKDCGILDHLTAGDLIIADKGFLIQEFLPDGVNLNIPPFLSTAQFSPEQVLQTRNIARARIHVERGIRRIKCFKILSQVPASLLPNISEIFQLCGALTNFQFPLIKEVEEFFVD